MGEKTKNIKGLFTNTRTRLIIIITIVALVVAILFGVVRMQKHIMSGSDASVNTTPQGIQSIPGSLNPTQQYASLQNKQNISQAESALKSGGSAIPTLIRSQKFTKGVGFVGASSSGKGSLGFTSLAQEQNLGGAKSLWLAQLKKDNCSLQAIRKVGDEGASVTVLLQACTCQELKSAGYTLSELKGGCNCKALKAAGFNAMQFKKAGYSASDLRDCGFSACELKNAGFTAAQLKDAGFTDGELKGAGFTNGEINAASGVPDGITAADIRAAGCGADGLRKLRAEGVSAAAIRRISGCSAAQLKAAGYTAKELKAAGFTAAELKNAGFTAAQLKKAGFNAAQLRDAGFTPTELAQAGFTPSEIQAAENTLPPGITPADIKKAGCSIKALKEEKALGISASAIRKYAGCSASALKAAGYTDADLRRAGFTPAQIAAADMGLPPGFTPASLKKAGCSIAALKKEREAGVSAAAIKKYAGCSASQLLAAGYTPAELKAAGFTAKQIKAAEATLAGLPPGVTASDVEKAGCRADALSKLRQEGVSAATIMRLNGCSAKQLEAAGYTPAQIRAAEAALASDQPITDAEIQKAGCSPEGLKKLHAEGVSASRIRRLNGCTASQLKAAGYTAGELKKAGFTNAQLRAAGFTPAEISAADDGLPNGITEADVKKAGCNPAALRKLRLEGVTATAIRKLNGCSAAQLKAAGYSAADLLKAGFTPKQLEAAGFTPDQIRDAENLPTASLAGVKLTNCSVAALKKARADGISALTIRKTLGCSASQMKAAGFTAAELKAAGFTAAQLKAAGFTAAQLKAAGFTAKQLRDAGFTAAQLKAAGFSAKQLKDAGFTAAQLKAAGFSARQLKRAGFSADELEKAGFSPSQLRNAGFSKSAIGDTSVSSSLPGLGNATKPQTNNKVLDGIEAAAGKSTALKSDIQKSDEKLRKTLAAQQKRFSGQKYQQEIINAMNKMNGPANEALGEWKKAPSQAFTYIGVPKKQKKLGADGSVGGDGADSDTGAGGIKGKSHHVKPALVKAGDIMFAVLETSVNSDEPGPVLATMVSGMFSGAKLIGSFSLPGQGERLVLTFNRMSVPGAPATTSITTVAIDPNTARTALSSRTNNHYLLRYGSLFASSFLEGFGQAFQSAGTTITVGGTSSDISVQQGIGRSVLENAVIGLADVGKRWGQQADKIFNRPPTVQLFSGTSLGILFTQDLNSI
jgi:intracellular multiplication protein IcmE